VDFDLTKEQEMIRKEVRRFISEISFLPGDINYPEPSGPIFGMAGTTPLFIPMRGSNLKY
jgi:hypothetical protein